MYGIYGIGRIKLNMVYIWYIHSNWIGIYAATGRLYGLRHIYYVYPVPELGEVIEPGIFSITIFLYGS